MSRLLRRLFRRTPARRRRAPLARPASYFRTRLLLQSLEARDVPATFTVTTTADSGAGSLRQAITSANNAAGADTIVFDQVAFANPQTIVLGGTELLITDDLTITGPGAALLTVSGNNTSRVFDTQDTLGTRVLNVTLTNMTVASGRLTSGAGAGLYTGNENVTLNNMVISGNTNAGTSFDSSGGGIAVGGGGALSLINTTISGNSASGRGGGIYFYDSGSLLLDSSTVSGNASTVSVNGGGGIYFYGTVGAGGLVIRNSTISGNSAAGSGGGVLLRNLDGTAVIRNSTITGNTSGTTSTAAGDGGGGIALNPPDSPGTLRGTPIVQLQSTIVSGNTASATNGRPDIAALSAAQITANNNAIGVNAGFTLTGSSSNNLFGATLNLQPLANNGGATQTIALGTGSAAIDAGSNPGGLPSDQRGTGFPRVQGSAADVGAFEKPVNAPSASGSFANVTTPGATSYTFTVTYSDATAINVGTLDNNDIRVTGPNTFNQLATFISVDNNTNGTPRTATYRITPPGGSWDSPDSGTYTVSVEPNQVANTNAVTVPAAAIGIFTVSLPQTFTVTNVNDTGAGSLRDAITQSNSTPGTADTIIFGPLFNTQQTISLTSGQLSVTDSVTVTGPGANLLTVRRDPGASSQFRVFNINPTGPVVITVSMTGMTITGGSTPTGPPNVTDNDGAGIFLGNESLTLDGVVITGNTAGTEGGGIAVGPPSANLVIRNSTISGNTASGARQSTGGGSGGGIYFFDSGSLLLENSTVSGNVSTNGEGGGIYFFGNVRPNGLSIHNSTISGNTAGRGGGGVALNTVTGQLFVRNSTITGNSTSGTVGGGGVAVTYGSGTGITVVSSIVSGNTNATAPDILSGGTVNLNNSAVGSGTGFTPSATSGNNLAFGANLLLGPLANNGGPTLTHALGTGSPAINAGSNPLNLTTDQRGTGFVRVSGPAADIGAFEGQATSLPNVSSVVVNAGQANTVQRSLVTSVTVNFDRVVTFVGGNPTAAFKLTRVGPGTPNGDVTLTVDLTGSTASQTIAKLTFSGALTEGSATTPSLIDGNYTLTVLSNQIQGGLTGGDSVTSLFRLFGDIDGNKTVNGLDLTAFRNAFGTNQGDTSYQPFLDFDGNGAINGTDLTQFRNRFGVILP
jgi:parallel beta-helix repeat protein